jgi:hypothetical protein
MAIIGLFAALRCTHVAPACAYLDFQQSPYDHIIEKIPATLSASTFTGRLCVRARDLEGGVWPSALPASIEIHGPDGFSEIVPVASDGTFRRARLSPGTYCFKVSMQEFRSVLGTVSISRLRSPRPIEIELIIAE